MAPNKEQLDTLRSSLRDDFAFWTAQCCNIRTKSQKIQTLTLNGPQSRLDARVKAQLATRGYVRIVILKARQQGFSTYVMARQSWRAQQNLAQKGLVMAHEADSTTALFDQYKRCYDNLPEFCRPATKYSSRTELVFSELDSAIRVATAGGRGIARGDTLTFAHLSEVAFWPTIFANANFGGLIKAVAQTAGTEVYVESTANGMSNKFKELWDGAVAGINEFEPFFSAWVETPEYTSPVPEGFVRTKEEIDEVVKPAKALYGIDVTDGQLQWRRLEIGRDGMDMFHQECPLTPEEAFLSTGMPVFDPKPIHSRIAEKIEPVRRMDVLVGKVEENSAGNLLVYRGCHINGRFHPVDPKEHYVIGADVGLGLRHKKADFSVAQILDSQKRQVAVWRGQVHPDVFAELLTTLGYFYNTARIGVERNNHGLLTAVRLRDSAYPNLYLEETEGTVEPNESINIGIYTTEKTRPLMIDKLRGAVRSGEIKIYDEATLKELLTFIVTESGKMEADVKCHDDTVMSLAIANHIHEGVWVPAITPEEMYVKGI